jgi:hypothetical protein
MSLGAPSREHSHLKAMRRSARQAAYLEPAGAPAGFLRPFYYYAAAALPVAPICVSIVSMSK